MHDMWDWPYILYVGRVMLGFSTAELWELTPRQFRSQWDIHNEVQRVMHSKGTGKSGKSPATPGYIDQLKGW